MSVTESETLKATENWADERVRRRSAAELADMSDADFAEFIQDTGIHTVSTAIRACSFVHTYKGEGLTGCGLEVVGPCPDCVTANGERT